MLLLYTHNMHTFSLAPLPEREVDGSYSVAIHLASFVLIHDLDAESWLAQVRALKKTPFSISSFWPPAGKCDTIFCRRDRKAETRWDVNIAATTGSSAVRLFNPDILRRRILEIETANSHTLKPPSLKVAWMSSFEIWRWRCNIFFTYCLLILSRLTKTSFVTLIPIKEWKICGSRKDLGNRNFWSGFRGRTTSLCSHTG